MVINMPGWGAIHEFLSKWVVPSAAVATLFIALFGGITYVIKSEVSDLRSDVGTMKENIKALTNDLASKDQSTNLRIDGLLKDALERAFPRPTGSKAELKGSLKHADELLQIARAEKLRLDPGLLASYGKQVAALSDEPVDSAAARRTLINLLDYRSFLNAEFVPSLSQLTPATGKSKYQSSVSVLPNPEHPEWSAALTVFFAGGYAAPDKSARLESLSNPQPESSEFAFFVIEGGMHALVLDGAYMKNVIIRNSAVVYSGGPVLLENVYFVNCTFKGGFQLPSGRDLGIKLLSAASVNFDSRHGATEDSQPREIPVELSQLLTRSFRITLTPSGTLMLSSFY
jgi:hypothetical protein